MPTITRFQGTGGIRPDVKQKVLPTAGAGVVESAIAGVGAQTSDFATKLLAERKRLQSINYKNQRTEIKALRVQEFTREAQAAMDPETGLMPDGRDYSETIDSKLREEDSLHSEDAPTDQARQLLRQSSDPTNKVSLLKADTYQHGTILKTDEINHVERVDNRTKELIVSEDGAEVSSAIEQQRITALEVREKEGLLYDSNEATRRLEKSGQSYAMQAGEVLLSKKQYQPLLEELSHYFHSKDGKAAYAEAAKEIERDHYNATGKHLQVDSRASGVVEDGTKPYQKVDSLQLILPPMPKKKAKEGPSDFERMLNSTQKNTLLKKALRGSVVKNKHDKREKLHTANNFITSLAKGDIPIDDQLVGKASAILTSVNQLDVGKDVKSDIAFDVVSLVGANVLMKKEDFYFKEGEELDRMQGAVKDMATDFMPEDPTLKAFANQPGNKEVLNRRINEHIDNKITEMERERVKDPITYIHKYDKDADLLWEFAKKDPKDMKAYIDHVTNLQKDWGQAAFDVRHIDPGYLKAEANLLKSQLEGKGSPVAATQTMNRWEDTFGEYADATLENMVRNKYISRGHAIVAKLPDTASPRVRTILIENESKELQKPIYDELNKDAGVLNGMVSKQFTEFRKGYLQGKGKAALLFAQDLELTTAKYAARLQLEGNVTAGTFGGGSPHQVAFKEVMQDNFEWGDSFFMSKKTMKNNKLTKDIIKGRIDKIQEGWTADQEIVLRKGDLLHTLYVEQMKLSPSEVQEELKKSFDPVAIADDTGIRIGVKDEYGRFFDIKLKNNKSFIFWNERTRKHTPRIVR